MNIWELYHKDTTLGTLLAEREQRAKAERESRLLRQYGTTNPETIKRILKSKKA